MRAHLGGRIRWARGRSHVVRSGLATSIDIVLIDSGTDFVFGFAKLDVMLGRVEPHQVRNSYDELRLLGVRFVNARINSIDVAARRVSTDDGEFTGDFLVIALGADFDFEATPGLREYGNEFYSVGGVERLSRSPPNLYRWQCHHWRFRSPVQMPTCSQRSSPHARQLSTPAAVFVIAPQSTLCCLSLFRSRLRPRHHSRSCDGSPIATLSLCPAVECSHSQRARRTSMTEKQCLLTSTWEFRCIGRHRS